MRNLPKVIFIDWNKTLSNSFFWHHLSNELHPNHKHHNTIEEGLFKHNKDLINPWMRGKITSDDVAGKISKVSGVDKEIILDELYKSAETMEFVSPEIPELLKKIRAQGIKIVIATDNMDTFRRYTIKGMKLDELFDDYLISYELKALKGDVEEGKLKFFHKHMKDNKLEYKDVILFDDSIDKTGLWNKLSFKAVEITSSDVLLKTLKEYAS